MYPATSAPSAQGRRSQACARSCVSIGTVDGFAQDGVRIAWLTRSGRGTRCVRILHVRSLSSGKTTTTRQPGCLGSESSPNLAFAGRAAVWQNITAGGNIECDVDLWTAQAGAKNATRLEHLHVAWDIEAGIAYPELPTAGAAGVLIYDAEHDDTETVRAIRRIVGGKPRTLFQFDRPVSTSVAGKRIAVIRQVSEADTGGFVTHGEVRSLSGARIAGFVAPGRPLGVALGARAVAVLTRSQKATSMSIFEAATGRLRFAIRVSPHAWLPQQAITGPWAVFSVGRTIRRLDLRTHSIATLGIAGADPGWFSVSGRRVAWVLNLTHGGARIVAATLPT